MSAEGTRLEQEAEHALRRWANLHGRLRASPREAGPLTIIDMPSGQEFILEVRAMPMGEADAEPYRR